MTDYNIHQIIYACITPYNPGKNAKSKKKLIPAIAEPARDIANLSVISSCGYLAVVNNDVFARVG